MTFIYNGEIIVPLCSFVYSKYGEFDKIGLLSNINESNPLILFNI
jgi:hypothetical protein